MATVAEGCRVMGLDPIVDDRCRHCGEPIVWELRGPTGGRWTHARGGYSLCCHDSQGFLRDAAVAYDDEGRPLIHPTEVDS